VTSRIIGLKKIRDMGQTLRAIEILFVKTSGIKNEIAKINHRARTLLYIKFFTFYLLLGGHSLLIGVPGLA